jgi:hypothetical protein
MCVVDADIALERAEIPVKATQNLFLRLIRRQPVRPHVQLRAQRLIGTWTIIS